jgi:transcriptional regulator with XRE-family HTH domain
MKSCDVDGAKLREARDDLELTGPQVIERIHADTGRWWSESTLYKVETGRLQPSSAFFGAMCRVYGRDKAEFKITAKAVA